MSTEPTVSYDEWLERVEAELYAAPQALQDKNLPFVRSSAARAQDFVQQAWRSRSVNQEVSQ